MAVHPTRPLLLNVIAGVLWLVVLLLALLGDETALNAAKGVSWIVGQEFALLLLTWSLLHSSGPVKGRRRGLPRSAR